MTTDYWKPPRSRFPNEFMPRHPTCNRMEWNSSYQPMRRFPSDNQRPPWNRNIRPIRSSDNSNWRSGPHWNDWNNGQNNIPNNNYNFQPPPRHYVSSYYPGLRFSEFSYPKQLPFVNSCTSSIESNDSSSGLPHPLSRRGSPIYPLRAFNNWAKVKVIQQAVPEKLEKSLLVMDLGCCKGVDLKKWAHSKVSHVYFVEEDAEELNECKRRYVEIKNRWPKCFDAYFYNLDYAYEDVFLPQMVDVVSCQFMIQRAFSSQEEAYQFAKNVSRALKPGGMFVVSLTNAEKIKELLNNSQDKIKTSNSIFSVELESPLPENGRDEFGIKMIFRVDDKFFPENLVHMSTMKRIFEMVNMSLVWQRSFPQIYEECKTDLHEIKLMTTMGVMENGLLMMSNPELETAHLYEAAMFVKQQPPSRIDIQNSQQNSEEAEMTDLPAEDKSVNDKSNQ